MQLVFILVFLIIPANLFSQELEFVKKAQSPCRENLVSLFEISGKDNLSSEEAKSAFQYAEKYYVDDINNGCGLFTNIESRFLKRIVLSYSSDSLVTNYIEYLRITQNSVGEARSSDFEEIFKAYPETVIRIVDSQEEEFRDGLVFHLAWGYLNNTYPESIDEPVKKFWLRYSELTDSNLRESPFIKDVITEIRTL